MRGTLAFESNGREVKGYYTDATTGIVSDSLMPDVNIDNARLTAALTPIAEGGRLSYRVASVSLSANIQATGPCGFVWDVCDFFGSYKARVKSEIENARAGQALRFVGPGLRGRRPRHVPHRARHADREPGLHRRRHARPRRLTPSDPSRSLVTELVGEPTNFVTKA